MRLLFFSINNNNQHNNNSIRATVMTRRRLASIIAALARWDRRICCLREGTVWLVDPAHWANVGGLN